MSLRGHRIGLTAYVPIERFLIVGIDSQQFALSAELVQGLLTMEESGTVSILTVQGQEYPSLDLVDQLGLAQAGDGPEISGWIRFTGWLKSNGHASCLCHVNSAVKSEAGTWASYYMEKEWR
jgi:hypothetical protein